MKTAFIDRDGTIIENSGYINTVQQVLCRPFVKGAVRGMRGLMDSGWQLILVTNQGGVGAGHLTEETLREIHAALLGRLAEHEVYFKNVRHCPHHPDAKCGCRKPLAGMLQLSALEDGADLKESIMIGDDEVDYAAGQAAGVRACYRVRPGVGWQAFDLREWPV